MTALRFAESDGKRTTAITPRGQERAESLLRELHDNPRLTQDDQGRRIEIGP
jgi:hypothetical protein